MKQIVIKLLQPGYLQQMKQPVMIATTIIK